MATQAYRNWVNAGRPFRVAKPVEYMVSYAKARGIAILGVIGNDDHLTSGFPEDHTPFSFTAWPVPLPDYVVCACDLANDKGLGAAILRDARAGRLPWLKYMNMAGKHYAYADGFKSGYDNNDQHIHLSVFSDETWTDISGYDPLGIPGGSTVTDLDYGQWKQQALIGGRPARVLVDDLWGQEMHEASPWGGGKSPRTLRLERIDGNVKALTEMVKAGGGNVDVAAVVSRLNEAIAKLNELQETLDSLQDRLAKAFNDHE